MTLEKTHIQFDIPDKEWAEGRFMTDALQFVEEQLQKEGIQVARIAKAGCGVLGTKCEMETMKFAVYVWFPQVFADGMYTSAVFCSNHVRWPIWKCLLNKVIPVA